jgi:serine/threonine protein kinase
MGYAAPEVFSRKEYSPKVDIYSVGSLLCILYLAAYIINRVLKDLPKSQKNKDNLPTLCEDYITRCEPLFSPLGYDFLKRLVKTDPKERFSAEEALNHDWILTNQNIE